MHVDLGDGRVVDFPDSMKPEEVNAAIKKMMGATQAGAGPSAAPAAAPAPVSTSSSWTHYPAMLGETAVNAGIGVINAPGELSGLINRYTAPYLPKAFTTPVGELPAYFAGKPTSTDTGDGGTLPYADFGPNAKPQSKGESYAVGALGGGLAAMGLGGLARAPLALSAKGSEILAELPRLAKEATLLGVAPGVAVTAANQSSWLDSLPPDGRTAVNALVGVAAATAAHTAFGGKTIPAIAAKHGVSVDSDEAGDVARQKVQEWRKGLGEKIEALKGSVYGPVKEPDVFAGDATHDTLLFDKVPMHSAEVSNTNTLATLHALANEGGVYKDFYHDFVSRLPSKMAESFDRIALSNKPIQVFPKQKASEPGVRSYNAGQVPGEGPILEGEPQPNPVGPGTQGGWEVPREGTPRTTSAKGEAPAPQDGEALSPEDRRNRVLNPDEAERKRKMFAALDAPEGSVTPYNSNKNTLSLRQVSEPYTDPHSGLENRTFNIDDAHGRDHGVLNTEYDPASQTLRVHSMDTRALEGGLTRDHANALLEDIRSVYPEARGVSGLRVTGTRAGAPKETTLGLTGPGTETPLLATPSTAAQTNPLQYRMQAPGVLGIEPKIEPSQVQLPSTERATSVLTKTIDPEMRGGKQLGPLATPKKQAGGASFAGNAVGAPLAQPYQADGGLEQPMGTTIGFRAPLKDALSLRSAVGEWIQNPRLMPKDIDEAHAAAIYKALSADISDEMAHHGAKPQWDEYNARASALYTAGNLLSRLANDVNENKNTVVGGKAVQALWRGMKQDSGEIANLREQLPEAANEVAAAFLHSQPEKWHSLPDASKRALVPNPFDRLALDTAVPKKPNPIEAGNLDRRAGIGGGLALGTALTENMINAHDHMLGATSAPSAIPWAIAGASVPYAYKGLSHLLENPRMLRVPIAGGVSGKAAGKSQADPQRSPLLKEEPEE